MFRPSGGFLVVDASHTHTHTKRFLFSSVILFLYLWVLTICSLTWQKDEWKTVWHLHPHLCWVMSGVNIIINKVTQFISCWCFRFHGNCLQILGCAMRRRVCKTTTAKTMEFCAFESMTCCSSVYSKKNKKKKHAMS